MEEIAKSNSEQKAEVSTLVKTIPSFSSASVSPLEEVKQILEEIKARHAELNAQEQRMAKQLLSGRSNAGYSAPPQKSEEEILKEEMKKMFKGTSVERYLGK